MSGPQFHPLPCDPAGEMVEAMFDVRSDEWILTAGGDYQTAAAETFTSDGKSTQRVVVLEWPGRVNHSDELRTVRLMMSPEDALGLADVLAHTAMWMMKVAKP